MCGMPPALCHGTMSLSTSLRVIITVCTLSVAAFAGLNNSEVPTTTMTSETTVLAPAFETKSAVQNEQSASADLWATTVHSSVSDAARECGVVAIKNAPAAVVVSISESGKVSAATVDSSLFGGADTEQCLMKELGSISVGHLSHETSLRTELVAIQTSL